MSRWPLFKGVLGLEESVLQMSLMENQSIDSQSLAQAYLYSEHDIPAPTIVPEGKYGELILLGYNGPADNRNHMLRKNRSKMELFKRKVGNGVKKGKSSILNGPASQAPLVLDSSRHVVSYTYSKNQTVLVEYVTDQTKDMFQIGRSSEEQIDFTVVDTSLASNNTSSPGRGKTAAAEKVVSSTISRYACRLLIDRENPSKASVYAAGFDGSRNIFLGEKATKWSKKNNEVDGLTTNGILILHPHTMTDEDSGSEDENGVDGRSMYVWREVSVDGDIYSLRETRSSHQRGTHVPNESNMLQDGTLIDLCGATLLWRSAEGLEKSPSAAELEKALDHLNAGKPQCPVNLNTLIIPRKRSTKSSTRQPYVYLRCGHVQGKHEWGMQVVSGATKHKCPICLVESERVIQLTMGMQNAFHLDSGTLDHSFNPCGHVASLRTVKYWSKIPLPHGTNSFHPVCPFCMALLATEKPYVRLIFQDHCFEGSQ